MRTSVLLALLCAVLVSSAAAQSTWALIDSNYATIAISCSFQQPNDGWVAGGTASVQSLILETTDGGATFTNNAMDANNQLASWLTIDVLDENTGIVGGFGFVGLQSGAYKVNGGNWTSIGSELICAYTDSKAVDTQTFAIIGIWSDSSDFTGNGVRFSSDGGESWSENNWMPKGSTNTARYGFWLDANHGYVTGGSFPVDDAVTHNPMKHLNEYIFMSEEGPKVDFKPRHFDASRVEAGYSGVITSATNLSTRFEVLQNSTGQYYFNEIWCDSTTECWVVATGVSAANLPASWIFYTDDGFQTMQQQFYGENMSLNTIDFSDSTTGWAGGAVIAPGAEFYAGFVQTTDGKTWTLVEDAELKNFFCYDISVVNSDYAYCAGLSAAGLSSFASFSPDN